MSAEILDADMGVLTIRISGKLRQSELSTAQKNAAEILKKRGGSSVLVLAEKFEGWEKGGDWGELSGQAQLDAQIDRMAIVGEKRWEDVALLFTGKGIRHIDIEYFSPTDLPRARSWLSSPRSSGSQS
jgi:SpoIIAA-like